MFKAITTLMLCWVCFVQAAAPSISFFIRPVSPSTLGVDLISYWSMDESSTGVGAVARVDSVSGLDLTDNNTTASGTGILGNAADFELANTEYLSRADEAAISTGDIDFSFSVWINTESQGGNMDILGKWSGEYLFRYNNASDRLDWLVVGTPLTTVTANNFGAVPNATWMHVVVYHSATDGEIGIIVNNGTPNTAALGTGPTDSASNFGVGSRIGSNYFDGLIDELYFWKKKLSATEITTLYGGGTPPAYP